MRVGPPNHGSGRNGDRHSASIPPAVFLAFSVVSALAFAACDRVGDLRPDKGWRAFAIEYGRSTFSEAIAVSGGDKGRRVPFSWMAWLLVGPDRVVLVDTGFEDPRLAKRWRVERFVPVDKLLEDLGVPARSVSDVVLTHLHWDHAGNTLPYVNARIWLQAEELHGARKRLEGIKEEAGGIRKRDLDVMALVEDQGRLNLLDGESEPFPGVRTHVGGKHTAGIQWLEVDTGSRAGTIVLASDYAYLCEGIEQVRPTGATADRSADVAQLRRMRSVVRDIRLVIPGHDPTVMDRFAKLVPRIVEIR